MKQIFINLPVTDLEKSKYFYAQLGFTNNSLFTGDNQICMSWSEHILVMLQTKEFFNLGNNKTISNTQKHLSASFTLPIESFERVNQVIEKGLKAGGKEPIALLDKGYMQVRTIEDLDGHLWSFVHLNIAEFEKTKSSNGN